MTIESIREGIWATGSARASRRAASRSRWRSDSPSAAFRWSAFPPCSAPGWRWRCASTCPPSRPRTTPPCPSNWLLIVPFVRLGGWLFSSAPHAAAAPGIWLHLPAPFRAASLMSSSAALMGHALAAWLLFAVPAVLILFAPLTAVAAPHSRAGRRRSRRLNLPARYFPA